MNRLPPELSLSHGAPYLVREGGCVDRVNKSLYCMIPEIGYTRQQYALTVKQAGEFGVPWVTPWLWLGGGCRRRVNAHSPATSACDPLWDYDIVCVRHCVCAFLHLHGPTYVQYDLPTTSTIHS